MNLEVDLDEVKSLLESQEYALFLLENTSDIANAAFILQAGLDALNNAIKSKEELTEI